MNDTNPPSPSLRTVPFEFRATGAEYFRIWIVNLLLTIVTIGIYSAWAKVRRLRYFYGSTLLDGASFEYHGKPLAILKGRLITVGAYAIFALLTQFFPLLGLLALPVVAFGVPWVIAKARLFQMRMSSYRGLRFNFHGRYGGALAAYVGWAIVAVFTLYLAAPLWVWKRVNYLLGNTSYANESFRFTTPRGRFFAFGYAAAGMLLGGVLLAGFGAGVAGAQAINATDPGEALRSGAFWAVLIPFLIVFLLVGAYYQRSLLNASFGGLEIGPHRLRSTLRTAPLAGLYLKNLVLLVVTLGVYYPWAKVALLRYQIENLSVEAEGGLDAFAASAADGTDALAEEVGDFFDVDFGL
ncbi:MAG: YjgN family protein [Steroidobacteraceae bacterium]